MHETPIPDRLAAQVIQLVGSEGWPLIPQLFSDSEGAALEALRADPLGPEAQAAAVKLAHIEELRNMFRSVTPTQCGDPFDATGRPYQAWNGQRSEPESEPDEDEYEI